MSCTKQKKIIYLSCHGEEAQEKPPGLEQNIIIITHGKTNGRATVNLIINILDSRTNHSSRLRKAKGSGTYCISNFKTKRDKKLGPWKLIENFLI